MMNFRNRLPLTAVILLFLANGNPVQAQPRKDAPAKLDIRQLLKTFNEEFVEITPGKGMFPKSFVMGTKDGPKSEQPATTVTMISDFAIAKYEVPQNLYEAVMGGNPSRWKGPRNSAEMMSWEEANLFCARCTKAMRTLKLIAEDEEIRLPYESEWEYCCRAGTTTAFSFGDKATKDGDVEPKASALDPYGWHTGNAAGNDPVVGALKPNAWGLYDMHGYLWEYVADDWRPNYSKLPKQTPAAGSRRRGAVLRTMRGGSWRDHYSQLRSAARQPIVDHAKSDAVGFRCVKAKVRK